MLCIQYFDGMLSPAISGTCFEVPKFAILRAQRPSTHASRLGGDRRSNNRMLGFVANGGQATAPKVKPIAFWVELAVQASLLGSPSLPVTPWKVSRPTVESGRLSHCPVSVYKRSGMDGDCDL